MGRGSQEDGALISRKIHRAHFFTSRQGVFSPCSIYTSVSWQSCFLKKSTLGSRYFNL